MLRKVPGRGSRRALRLGRRVGPRARPVPAAAGPRPVAPATQLAIDLQAPPRGLDDRHRAVAQRDHERASMWSTIGPKSSVFWETKISAFSSRADRDHQRHGLHDRPGVRVLYSRAAVPHARSTGPRPTSRAAPLGEMVPPLPHVWRRRGRSSRRCCGRCRASFFRRGCS